MATITLINVKRPPWNRRLRINPNSIKSDQAVILEKNLAEKLYAIAEKEKGYIWLNSAFRTPGQDKLLSKSSAKRGTSHEGGMAADIQTITYEGEDPKTVLKNATESAKRRSTMLAAYSIGKDAPLRWGPIIYSKSGPKVTPGSIVYYDSKGKEISSQRINGINAYEAMHVENIHNNKEVRAINGQVITDTLVKYSSDSGTAGTALDTSKYYLKDTFTLLAKKSDGSDETVKLKDVDEIVFNTDTSGKIIYSETDGNRKIASGVSFIKHPENDLKNIEQDINKVKLTLKEKNIDGYVEVVPSSVGVDRRIGIPVPKGRVNGYDAAMSTPLDFNNGEPYRYISRKPYPTLYNSKPIPVKDLQLGKSSVSKLEHNRNGCLTPAGMLQKYADNESPAAIRLIQDKLYQYELSTEAKAAWEKWESAGITYIDCFLINQVTINNRERYNIQYTMDDKYRLIFGSSEPTTLKLTGYIFNTKNRQWWYDFNVFYHEFLKGSKLAKNKIRAFLTLTDAVYEVVILDASFSESGRTPGVGLFGLDLIVLDWTPFGEYSDPFTRNRRNQSTQISNYSTPQVQLSDKAVEAMDAINHSISAVFGYPVNTIPTTEYKTIIDQIHLTKSSDKERLPLTINYGGRKVVVDVDEADKEETEIDRAVGEWYKSNVIYSTISEINKYTDENIDASTEAQYDGLDNDTKNIVNKIGNIITANFERNGT